METGIVKRFIVNKHGGYGFLVLPTGEELYFQRNDGGPVGTHRSGPRIETWSQVREPKPGDRISFERAANLQGAKAAPWCFADEWDNAVREHINRPTFRLMCQEGRRILGDTKRREVWKGKHLPDLQKMFPEGLPLTHQYINDSYFYYWFEREISDDTWEKLNYDPRLKQMQDNAVA